MKKKEQRLVLAGCPETGEIYAAQVIDEEKRGHVEETLPIVRIVRVARYPDQHALQYKDVALEIPALPEGLMLRMAILTELSDKEKEAFLGLTWEKCLREAQEQALLDAKNEREKEIIQRHISGEYLRKRIVRCYTADEIKRLTGK